MRSIQLPLWAIPAVFAASSSALAAPVCEVTDLKSGRVLKAFTSNGESSGDWMIREGLRKPVRYGALDGYSRPPGLKVEIKAGTRSTEVGSDCALKNILSHGTRCLGKYEDRPSGEDWTMLVTDIENNGRPFVIKGAFCGTFFKSGDDQSELASPFLDHLLRMAGVEATPGSDVPPLLKGTLSQVRDLTRGGVRDGSERSSNEATKILGTGSPLLNSPIGAIQVPAF
jgi:hypothetical protein